MSSHPVTFITPEQYLTAERKAERKSEYLNGEVFAMAGASRRHVRIVGNIDTSLNVQLQDGECEVFAVDLRVRVNPRGDYMYAYPDISVACGEPLFEDGLFDTLLNPKVIIEVLSPTTESSDRGPKAALYRKLDSLFEYVLVAQDRVRVEHFVRQPSGEWTTVEKDSLQDAIELSSIAVSLPLSDIYRRVKF